MSMRCHILIQILKFYNLLYSVGTMLVYKHYRFTCLQTLYFQSVYSRVSIRTVPFRCGPSEWGLRWFESSDRTILVLPFSPNFSMSITLVYTAGRHVGRDIALLYLYVPIHKVVGLERAIHLNSIHQHYDPSKPSWISLFIKLLRDLQGLKLLCFALLEALYLIVAIN